MKKYLSVLKKCALFDGIKDEELESLLCCLGACVEFFDKKYTIFASGTSARYFGVMLSGEAQISYLDYFGNRSIVESVAPGQTFLEAFACAQAKDIAVTVIATQASEVLLIDCAHITHTCKNNCGFHQRLIFNLMKDIASKNILLHQRIEVTSKRTTREKLLAYLNFVSRQKRSASFEIPFDRQELADYLEVDRSGLSVQISALVQEGVLEARKNKFVLLEKH